MKNKLIFTVLLLAGALAFITVPVWSQDMPGGKEQKQERVGPGATGGEKLSADEIKKAQQALKEKGHDPGAIDGKMSPQTTSAIRAFQKSQGLQATGQLDERTLKSLGVEKGEKAPGGAAPGAKPGRESGDKAPGGGEEK